jgi:hypothetical protein
MNRGRGEAALGRRRSRAGSIAAIAAEAAPTRLARPLWERPAAAMPAAPPWTDVHSEAVAIHAPPRSLRSSSGPRANGSRCLGRAFLARMAAELNAAPPQDIASRASPRPGHRLRHAGSRRSH